MSVFGEQKDATSLRDDLVHIVSRGRAGSRWRSHIRWPSYVASVLALYLLWQLGLSAYSVEAGGYMTAWTADQIRIALNLSTSAGAVCSCLGVAFDKFVFRAVNSLFPMVTIALGRGVEAEERRKRI